MPSFPWAKSNRIKSEAQQPGDLPTYSQTQASATRPFTRSVSVSERTNNTPGTQSDRARDRSSVAIFTGAGNVYNDLAQSTPGAYSPDDGTQQTQNQGGFASGLRRSQTVLKRDASPTYDPAGTPSPLWSSGLTPTSQLPTPIEQDEAAIQSAGSMTSNQQNPPTPSKSSSDSGQATALDRWSQRRLQRLNTEQGFREQRQGGQGVLSPTDSRQTGYNPPGIQFPPAEPQSQQAFQQPAQPLPSQQVAYQARAGPGSQPNASALAVQPDNNTSRSPYQEQSQVPSNQQRYSPPDSNPHYQSQESRPQLQQARSFTQAGAEESMSNNGGLPAPKPVRSGAGNRQSVHNGLTSREGSGLTPAASGQNMAGLAAGNVPSASQGRGYGGTQGQQQAADVGRATPQPVQLGEDMSEEEVTQLIKEHKELREKYTKVKKYYFEKEDQVKQLQNSLAHQRLSQSRTSLDDSEYTTRFNRLDGLIAQLAFSIRKSWKSMPSWLVGSVNKDAVATGKQEMTAAGRAFIASWLVEEVFDKYFHPDLDPTLSAQLKSVQRNIRRFAPPAQSSEEEEYLTAKVVNWRLSTLEGLQDALRSPECPTYRAQLTDLLKEHLISALAVHLQDPPPSDLEGGVHMIVELVVSIAIHLPLESRDVQIEYFTPGHSIMPEQMKLESGIPPLTVSIADDAAERASMKSAASDITDMTDPSNTHDQQPKKRSMLSALTGTGKKSGHAAQGKHAGAGGSSSSLNRPESSAGMKENEPPRVRMAAGIGVQIRGRAVLVKAPVFST